jgi:hypothetical protein
MHEGQFLYDYNHPLIIDKSFKAAAEKPVHGEYMWTAAC